MTAVHKDGGGARSSDRLDVGPCIFDYYLHLLKGDSVCFGRKRIGLVSLDIGLMGKKGARNGYCSTGNRREHGYDSDEQLCVHMGFALESQIHSLGRRDSILAIVRRRLLS